MEKNSITIKKWILWLMLIVFPPFGITIMWFGDNYKLAMKLVISILGSAYFLIILFLLGKAR
ncbi:MAG: hypothetical protein R3232_06205 [Clostridia bacterium]|nr:hypothetical protein [Clostridia bacterium]